MEVLLAAWVVLVQPGGPQEDPYRTLVEQLSSDDPAERDRAAFSLRRAGRAAWPQLERAARCADPEVAGRARDILRAAQIRRRLSFRVLDAFPGADAALLGGPPAARAALARAMASHLEESREFLLRLLDDPDPETALAAAESLADGRTSEWVPRLLDLLAGPQPPFPSRIIEMLSGARRTIRPDDLRARFEAAAPEGRARLLELSGATQIPFPVDAREVLELLQGPRTRAGAMEWIGGFNRREFAIPLEDRLLPEAPDVLDILRALRRLGHPIAGERLAPLLRHESEEVREQTLMALFDDEDPSTDPLLAALIEDPSAAVRQRAIQTLAHRRGDAARETLLVCYLTQDGGPRDAAAGLLCRTVEWTAERARALIQEADADRRLRGAELLARIEGLAAVQHLAADADEQVRRWLLARALSVSDETSAAILRRLAGDASEPIRFEALKALARSGRPEDVEALAPYLDSLEFSFRYPATEIYLRHAGEKSRDLVTKLLDDPDAAMQCLAITALYERASPEAADRVVGFLTSRDAALRRAAAAYLEQAVRSTRDPALVARVGALLERLDGDTLAQAAAIVAAHGSAEQAPVFRKLLDSGRAPSESRALEALSRWHGPAALLDCLTEERAAAILDQMAASAKSRPLDAPAQAVLARRLGELVSSPWARTRRAVAQCLPDLAPPGADALVAVLLDDVDAAVRHGAIRAARKLSLAVAPRLREMLDDEDPEVRIAAALALAEIDERALPAVDEQLAREECDWVARRVSAGLRR